MLSTFPVKWLINPDVEIPPTLPRDSISNVFIPFLAELTAAPEWSLKIGDEVVTVGGIHGKIARIKDDVFVIESGVGTMKSFVMIDRSAV
ncbi:MAG: preprotein translocase subunit YajC, partial [Clostridia bacterium]|nr:preprotein translocase subunit YajC [Clostridia bacterium]